MQASIVIPTFNHAEYLPTAIDSALAQTVPCEVIVVDDGSTDDTHNLLLNYAQLGVGGSRIAHAGVAAARNHGLDLARADFVMFLDADDVIDRRKVERQLDAFREGVGWVLCDVRIEHESGKRTTASEQYGYADLDLAGVIAPLLVERNFIPVMSPLVRADVVREIRFPEGKLEDWAFWRDVARVACVAYVPEVLATYRRRGNGRHNAK